jgi:hypothetical protein
MFLHNRFSIIAATLLTTWAPACIVDDISSLGRPCANDLDCPLASCDVVTKVCVVASMEDAATIDSFLSADVDAAVSDLLLDAAPDPDMAPDTIPDPPPPIASDDGWQWVHPLPQGQALASIWGDANDNLWAVGIGGTILRYDGYYWRKEDSSTTETLSSVWGSDSDHIWAIGSKGTVVTRDSQGWKLHSQSDIPATASLIGISGTSATDLWICDLEGRAYYSNDGSTFPEVKHSFASGFLDVTAVGPGQAIFARGQKSTVQYGLGGWLESEPGAGTSYSVWGTATDDFWAVGKAGLRARNTSGDWITFVDPPLTNSLYRVRGSSSSNVWAVGSSGQLQHFDGLQWTAEESALDVSLSGLWVDNNKVVYAGAYGHIGKYANGTASAMTTQFTSGSIRGAWQNMDTAGDDLWFVGEKGLILHYDATGLTVVPSGTEQTLRGIWGSSATSIWAVGHGGTLLHYDGLSWAVQTKPELTSSLYAIHGVDSTSVWAVGAKGTIIKRGIAGWSTPVDPAPTAKYLYSVWVGAKNAVWAGGSSGTILKYDGQKWAVAADTTTTSSLYALWGNSTNTEIWAAGTGGGLIRYADGTWASVGSPTSKTIYNLSGVDVDSLRLVTGGGEIFRRSSSGWLTETSGIARELYGAVTNSKGNWIFGKGGAILKNTTSVVP